MLLADGGSRIAKLNLYRNDFTEYKYELIDSFDYEYYDKAICYIGDYSLNDLYVEKRYLDNEHLIDHYNGYIYDEYGDIVEDYPSKDDDVYYDYYTTIYDEVVYIVTTTKCHNFILHRHCDLYKCDKCGKKFVDYRNFYKNRYKKDSLFDFCWSCKVKITRSKRKENIQKALTALNNSGLVKTSKPQKYLAKLLGGELNKQIGNIFADILIGNIVIEYDGSGHWAASYYEEATTKEDIDKKDFKRDKWLQSQGYKVIRIVSEKDYLPSDESILRIIKNAKEEFDKGKNFYRIVIDENNFNKDELRKITDNDLKEMTE